MEAKAQEIGIKSHPKKHSTFIGYGTAGFRTKADLLDHVMFRMGLLASLRSKSKNGETIGVMITASHNLEIDNGVKLVDPDGAMLEQNWEGLATKLANANDSDIEEVLKSIIKEQGIDISAVLDGIECDKLSKCTDFGVVTTPQLHFFVVCKNTKGAYGNHSEEGYYKKLSNAFVKLDNESTSSSKYSRSVSIDGANGVGAHKIKLLKNFLPSSHLDMTLYNDGTQGKLNLGCGADFVKVNQKAPSGMESIVGDRCVSIDGDADRVVYFYADEGNKFYLLDGDRIATLIASYLKDLLAESGLQFRLGIVQTAYANGNSTDYIKNKLKLDVACASTGVKNLHHLAKNYDIGVYFEANGHGTTIFSPECLSQIPQDSQLKNLVDLINQTGWSAGDWYKSYEDLPNRQLKVKVANREVIQTADAERQCVSPPGLQDKINEVVLKFPKGRSFVRPSGTEDVVRVYAESDTQDNADQLAYEVGLLVHQNAGGVGEPTPKPQ
ncbi:PGM3 [Lepeophtheirus salmonis]|uniref:phosphoacetylglucosamine mutase n=1 Tax=Lepeophtheirus salmonis TaxID=72036 RepID=A0A7R8CMP8_LEPSM|nr:PGM3 [Lepeophtheirus salmonis]CAF2868255.1 PGM3 [Lepeophtheirus salmonis]